MGVDYFPCGKCKIIVCDCDDHFGCSNCYRIYCVTCGNNLKKEYPALEPIDNKEIYRCHYCDDSARMSMVRSKIKKLEAELKDLEFKFLNLP